MARVCTWLKVDDHGNECAGSMKYGEFFFFLTGPLAVSYCRRNMYHVFIIHVIFD